jgi:hypothetical protein
LNSLVIIDKIKFFTIINNRMSKYIKTLGLCALVLVLYGCGAKPAMEGGSSDSTEYGSVSDSSNPDGSGSGDSTSFAEESVEKVDEYVVRRGDNLWNIAAKASVYRSGWLYPLILKANRGKITDPKNLAIGLALKVPRGLSKAEHDVAREEAMAGTFENEVGTLLEMKTDLPTVSPQAVASPAARGEASAGGGWLWVLWILLAGLLGAGAWWALKKRREKNEESGAGSPPAE